MSRPIGEEKKGGRIAGVPNKKTAKIRDMFQMIVEGNIGQLEQDLKELKPVDRVKAIIDLSKFCVPTLKAVDFTDITPVDKKPIRILFEKK